MNQLFLEKCIPNSSCPQEVVICYLSFTKYLKIQFKTSNCKTVEDLMHPVHIRNLHVLSMLIFYKQTFFNISEDSQLSVGLSVRSMAVILILTL